ncbi:MAG: hypothetical protein RIS94_174 [Pseudomonadota bacterium]
MATTVKENARVTAFRQPPRPDWVRQVNEEGHALDIKGIVPLDPASLIATARANTGLDDFGADDWRDPFERMVRALDAEAQLTLIGRIMTRSDLLMHLEARLRVEDAYRRHPEIEAEVIERPVLIVGSGRSGTSALLNLLAEDPGNHCPRHWEALFPVEVRPGDRDERIALAHARMDMWNRVTPEIASMHEFGGDLPTEQIQIEALSFQSNGWLDLYGLMPSFSGSLALDNYRNAQRYARRVLKLLQWTDRREGRSLRRWVLKSPDAMRYLPAVFEAFPDLQLVWAHRDPVKAVSSAVSLIGTLFYIRSDQPLSPLAIAQLTDPAGLAGLFGMVMDQMDSGAIPAAQVHSVHYGPLVEDPMGTVQQLYRDLAMPFTVAARESIGAYIAAHPRSARPAHVYKVGDNGTVSEERRLFNGYETRFGVQREV